jgi:choline dehydrogenase
MNGETINDGAAFSYIVVGAGSAGAVLAARLSEHPGVTVCLVEAGGPDDSVFLSMPLGLAALPKVKKFNWSYVTAPQPRLNGRRLWWPRGKTLGGSSSVNAMCYIRGLPDDYDGWAQDGASGWNWANVLPYFKKAEDQQRGPDDYHGTGGPLTVSDLRHVSPLSRTFCEAGTQLQIRSNADFNGPSQEGVGLYQVTQRGGQRCSTALAYLRPAMARKNLAVLTNALAEAILFDGRRATGLKVRHNGRSVKLKAEREVLVCGGAINSPQLLMLSGIGPAAHLKEHGIAPLLDLPGVGGNLQDHLDVVVRHSSKAREGYGIAAASLPRLVREGLAYRRAKQGMLTSNIAEAGGFVRVMPEAAAADVQFHFLPAPMRDHGRKTVWGYGYTLHTCCLLPKSRGEIRLASPDPAAAPSIDPRYLENDEDAAVMVAGLKLARRILQAPAFAAYRGIEVEPGPSVRSDAELVDFIRASAETIYHPVGTCRMGDRDDPRAVVDPELKVIGVDGLRVVDASVMPTIIRGNTNAPTIMIGERAADLISGRVTV